MDRLTSFEQRKLLDFAALLLECRGKTALAQAVVNGLATMIEAEEVVWNEVNERMEVVSGVFSKGVSSHSRLTELGETFQKVAHTHPALEKGIVKFDKVAAYRLTDVISQSEFEETQVFKEVYQPLSFEYLIGFDCGSQFLKGLAVAFSRTRKDFSDRELLLLEEAAKLVARAYELEESWQEPLPDSQAAHWNVKLDRDLIITEATPEARALLEHFYDTPQVRFCLPWPLHELLLRRRSRYRNASWRDQRPRSFQKGRERIHVLTCRTPAFEHLVKISAPKTMKLDLKKNGVVSKLSERELEVAKLYVQGKSPKEIAAALQIADRTVHAHRQTIFRKLQVSSVPEMIEKLLGL